MLIRDYSNPEELRTVPYCAVLVLYAFRMSMLTGVHGEYTYMGPCNGVITAE